MVILMRKVMINIDKPSSISNYGWEALQEVQSFSGKKQLG
jgi:hypothetical protein